MKKRPKSLLEEKDQRQSHVTGKDQHHFFGLQLHRLVIEHYVLSSFSALIGSDQKKKGKSLRRLLSFRYLSIRFTFPLFVRAFTEVALIGLKSMEGDGNFISDLRCLEQARMHRLKKWCEERVRKNFAAFVVLS